MRWSWPYNKTLLSSFILIKAQQYAAWLHTERLLEVGVKISMSDKASPQQNGIVERFMRTVKEEHVD